MEVTPMESNTNVNGFSRDFRSELAGVIQSVAPEVVSDGKIDFVKLEELLKGDIQGGIERFGLFWPGKKQALRIAQEPTSATLLPSEGNSADWDTTQNIFIEGDNLEVLKILQKRYHNSIKVIYIDPPYNTGGEFIYPDKFQEGLTGYLEFSQQINADGQKLNSNSESDGRFHSNWLSMMYPRLKLARNLLTDDGVIFISIDDHEIENLLRIGKEIFGENNHATTFIWQKKKKPSFLHANVGSMTEYVVAFTRNFKSTFPFSIDTTTEGKKYPLNNAGNGIRTLRFPAGSVNFTDSDAMFLPQDMTEGNIKSRLLEKVIVKNHKNVNEIVLEGEWRYSQEKLDSIISAGELITISKAPFRPNHVKAGGEIKKMHNLLTPQTYNMDTNEDATAHLSSMMGGDYFDNPKPVSLIKTLLKAVTYDDPEATVLDFFAGSGSTAEAVIRLNQEEGGRRNFILVQLPEPTKPDTPAFLAGYKTISSLSRARILRVREALASGDQGLFSSSSEEIDSGFRAFTLAESNFGQWRASSSIEKDELQGMLLDLQDSAKDGANQSSLLFEILLKLGVGLGEQLTRISVANLELFSIGENSLLIYLNQETKPSLEQLRMIAELNPAKLVVLEDAFQGDDQLKTNFKQICKSSSIELWTA
jgi:adenine-specific DNA-methyltransferase